MSASDLKKIRWIVGALCSTVLALILITLFFTFYPFKTVEFYGQAEVMNPGKRIPVNGVVEFKFQFHKFTDLKGLVIRTLIRHDGSEIAILDSNTVVSTRKKSNGKVEGVGFFYLNGNPEIAGKNCQVIFTVYYTLFGVRTIVVQCESEPFEIYNPGGPECPPTK